VSLLLLFHNSGIVPHADGTAAGVAGSAGSSQGSRAASGSARATAGAEASSVGVLALTIYGSAYAIAGGYAASIGHGAHVASGAAALAGAYARGIGGRGVLDGRAYAVGGPFARVKAKALRVGTPLIMLTRLVLSLDPSEVAFTKPGASGPYPLLLSIGTLRLAARAGHISGIGSTESTSVTVSLDNTGGHAAAIIGRPLRVRARIYDGPDLFFDGTVAAIAYGQTIELQIEA
jgi:hypothetical protein